MGEIKQRGRESALITYWADGFLDEVLRRCILLHTDTPEENSSNISPPPIGGIAKLPS